MKGIVSIVIVCCLTAILLFGLGDFPPYGKKDNPAHNEVMDTYIHNGLEQTGAVNVVSGIILDYRAFDTFVEAVVLFTALLAVSAVLGKEKGL